MQMHYDASLAFYMHSYFLWCGWHLVLLQVTKFFHGAETDLIHNSDTVIDTCRGVKCSSRAPDNTRSLVVTCCQNAKLSLQQRANTVSWFHCCDISTRGEHTKLC